ncbi:MAG: bifunctional adenosylcobinamide kinase/adenosylcobinamide-phosphate guanylyltransferase [Rhodospirillaceae bacterium]|nr:bifunctional adenosylcobinamide kinase/adenosylcobinamide-phosphate guanylyltransferase [Rhodospirillaceae bacterium]
MTNGSFDISLTELTFVLGGARSGKSAFAESIVEETGGGIYVATAQARDNEMAARIEAHKKRRGPSWQSIEEPTDLAETLVDLNGNQVPVLVDCLTLWLSNILEIERNIDNEIATLCNVASSLDYPVVFVSNEIGLGVIPENVLARRFIDLHGSMNQWVATVAGQVVMVTAGIAHRIK